MVLESPSCDHAAPAAQQHVPGLQSSVLPQEHPASNSRLDRCVDDATRYSKRPGVKLSEQNTRQRSSPADKSVESIGPFAAWPHQ